LLRPHFIRPSLQDDKWDEFTKLTDEASVILVKATEKRLARNMSYKPCELQFYPVDLFFVSGAEEGFPVLILWLSQHAIPVTLIELLLSSCLLPRLIDTASAPREILAFLPERRSRPLCLLPYGATSRFFFVTAC
jgi:hypothetical protein